MVNDLFFLSVWWYYQKEAEYEEDIEEESEEESEEEEEESEDESDVSGNPLVMLCGLCSSIIIALQFTLYNNIRWRRKDMKL